MRYRSLNELAPEIHRKAYMFTMALSVATPLEASCGGTGAATTNVAKAIATKN